MRTAIWFSVLGLPNTGLVLPYTTQSPTLKKVTEYKTVEDIYEEIDRILNEEPTKKFGVGQSLFYQMPFFAEPSDIIPDWCWHMIEDYFIIKKYNVPMAKDLKSVDAWTSDCFILIDEELENIKKHKAKLNG